LQYYYVYGNIYDMINPNMPDQVLEQPIDLDMPQEIQDTIPAIPEELLLASQMGRVRYSLLNNAGELGSIWHRARHMDAVVVTGQDEQGKDKERFLLAPSIAGPLMIATQIADRARISTVLVPKVAVDTLKNTGSPTEAALLAGGLFLGWCATVGYSTARGLKEFPEAVGQAKESYAGIVGFFQDSLPGIELPTEEERKQSLARRAGRRILTGINRGWTVTGIGTVAYVTTASFDDRPYSKVSALNRQASLDGGLVAGAIVVTAGELIEHVVSPKWAERITDFASDTWHWYAIAGGIMTWTFGKNKLKARKIRREEQAAVKAEIEAVQELPFEASPQ
jgi:hypothetical protein